jgi:hypothetical protein
MSGSAFAVTHPAVAEQEGQLIETTLESKTPSYTKSVVGHHKPNAGKQLDVFYPCNKNRRTAGK